MEPYSPKYSCFDKEGRMAESRRLYNDLTNRRKLRMFLTIVMTLVNFLVQTAALTEEFSGIWCFIMPVYSVAFTSGLLVLSHHANYENKVLLPILLGGFVVGMVVHAYSPVIAIFLFALFFTQSWEYKDAQWVMAQDGYPDFVYEPDETDPPDPAGEHFKKWTQVSEMESLPVGHGGATGAATAVKNMVEMPALDAGTSGDLKSLQEHENEQIPLISQIPLESVPEELSSDLTGAGTVDMRDAPRVSGTLSRHTGWLGAELPVEHGEDLFIPDVGETTSDDLHAGAPSENEKVEMPSPESLSDEVQEPPREQEAASVPAPSPDPTPFPDIVPFSSDPLPTSDFPDIAGNIQDLPDLPDLPDIPDISTF